MRVAYIVRGIVREHIECALMRDWNDVLPPDVALMQNADERRRAIARAIVAGASLKEIAARMHRHPERVRQLHLTALRRREIPIERWFRAQGDILKLSAPARRAYRRDLRAEREARKREEREREIRLCLAEFAWLARALLDGDEFDVRDLDGLYHRAVKALCEQ